MSWQTMKIHYQQQKCFTNGESFPDVPAAQEGYWTTNCSQRQSHQCECVCVYVVTKETRRWHLRWPSLPPVYEYAWVCAECEIVARSWGKTRLLTSFQRKSNWTRLLPSNQQCGSESVLWPWLGKGRKAGQLGNTAGEKVDLVVKLEHVKGSCL